MKTAKFTVESIALTCPVCGGDIPSPGGSLYWEVIECGQKNLRWCRCDHCNIQLKFPKGV